MAGSGLLSSLIGWPFWQFSSCPLPLLMPGSCAAFEINGLRSGAQTLLELFGRWNVALHDGLELVAGMEGDDVARLDRHRFAGARIAAGARALLADREVAEARQLDLLALDQRLVQQVEEGLDDVLGLALVQADAVEQQLGKLGLGQRGRLQRRQDDGI